MKKTSRQLPPFGPTAAGIFVATLLATGFATAAQVSPGYQEFGGGTSPGTPITVNGTPYDFTQPNSYFFGDTVSNANGATIISGSVNALNNPNGSGFYDAYVFTIAPGQVDAVTSTTSLSNLLGISDLEVRLYNLAGNSPPVIGTPAGGAIDAWSNSYSAGASTTQVSLLQPTTLGAGTYVLEVRGTVSGTLNGSYSGVLNVTAVPLPASAWLMLSGIGGLALAARRRRAAIA